MRKKKQEHVNHERWLVSYADFITLLFAFFVIMYATSQADIVKFKKVAESLRKAFAMTAPEGMIDVGTPPAEDEGSAEKQRLQDPVKRSVIPPPAVVVPPTGGDSELRQIKEALDESMSLEVGVADTSEKLRMDFDNRGLVLRLAAKDFFEPGRSEVSQDLRPLLDRIGKVVAKSHRPVRIEGHSDASEAKLGPFYNGWELSTARATWVLQYWVKRFDLDPGRFSATGFGQYRPLSSRQNDEWAQGRNRRVEIVILGKTDT